MPAREDVADALIAPEYQTIEALPQGARVGTSSPRRRAQLLFLRPDLQVVTLRGNVETRLNQALERRLDAVVLAWAGLRRLGLERHVTQRLEPSEFLPAVGQGALGIECRRDDAAILALLEPLDDPASHRAVLAERTVLAALEGGCTLPMAAWARDVEGDETNHDGPALALDAAVFDPDGRARVAVTLRGARTDPDGLGRRAAKLCVIKAPSLFWGGDVTQGSVGLIRRLSLRDGYGIKKFEGWGISKFDHELQHSALDRLPRPQGADRGGLQFHRPA